MPTPPHTAHKNGTGAGAPRATEVELKYRVTDRTVAEAVLAAATLGSLEATGDITATHHDDRYFDTASGALRNAGYAARLRRTPDGVLLTLKSRAVSSRPLHRREELEAPATRTLQPLRWPPSEARSLLLELSGDDRLVETLHLDQTRHRRTFAADGTSVELSLDDVRVLAGTVEVDRFVELEAELTSGDERNLEQIERLLTGIPGLDSSPASKLDAAELAVGRREQRAPRAGNSRRDESHGVDGDDSLAVAATTVIEQELARMIKRTAGARRGRTRDLHAMRVATRRQRAALRLFGDVLPRRDARQLRRGLRGIARSLGAVRDLDVLIDMLDRHASALPAGPALALQPLRDELQADREDAVAEIVSRLDSRRYRRLVNREEAFLDRVRGRQTTVRIEEPHLVRDTAPARIWARYHAVRAYEPVVDWADVAMLHELRIAAKHLRYSIEFFGDALGSEGAEVVSRIVGLQDHLGELHDADVAAAMARDFLRTHGVSLTPAQTVEIGRYLVDRETEVTRLRGSLAGPWRDVSGTSFRAQLGRALAQL